MGVHRRGAVYMRPRLIDYAASFDGFVVEECEYEVNRVTLFSAHCDDTLACFNAIETRSANKHWQAWPSRH